MIVEDDKIISEELTHLLETSGYNVITLTNYDNTLEDILNSNFDLLLLDINLPKVNGEFLLKEIRKVSNVPIIMLTSRALETDEVLSMSYGADDYITKPYNPTILLLRIANIFRRMEKNVNSLNYDDIKVYQNKGILVRNDKELDLTKNEMLIFLCLLNNRGNIVTRDELMTELWNNEEYVNENALTVNVSRLRSKLEDFGIHGAIETRKGQGYKLL
ncbi:response regulator receiver domain protein [Firmicutes bacterium CAG:822]|nr:response regulator receiver domain protein [Firmicutes bacterium CAG:822]